MNKRFIRTVLTVGATSLGSFYYGAYKQQQKTSQYKSNYEQQQIQFLQKHSHKPGFPLFATVSAAVTVPEDKANLPTTSPSSSSQIKKYGLPSSDTVLSYSDFILGYNHRNRAPAWVFEHLTEESLAKNESVCKTKCLFKVDKSIHPIFQSQSSDYKGSVFERGHMAAPSNHIRDQKHMEDTFHLTNVAPQMAQCRLVWKRLERYARRLTKSYSNVYVCSGPLYLPEQGEDEKKYVKYEVIGKNNVAVPTHFFKIIVGETADNQVDMEAYIIPNQAINEETPLPVFQVSPAKITRAAGLLFFENIYSQQLRKLNGRKFLGSNNSN